MIVSVEVRARRQIIDLLILDGTLTMYKHLTDHRERQQVYINSEQFNLLGFLTDFRRLGMGFAGRSTVRSANVEKK